jgi:hypothetical protein
MPSPFPGMDPWLEAPEEWGDVHAQFMVDLKAALNKLIRPKYLARVERRLYLIPDDDPTLKPQRVADVRVVRGRGRQPRPKGGAVTAVRRKPLVIPTVVEPERQWFLDVQDAATKTVVTTIEVLSPSNKRAGAESRKQYLAKYHQVTGSPVHWVEIDLLRTGERHPWQAMLEPHDYLCHVSPADRRPDGLVWPITVAEPLPVLDIPLAAPDPPAKLDLQAVFAESYDRGSWDGAADYCHPPVPPLPPELDAWADRLLRSKGLR